MKSRRESWKKYRFKADITTLRAVLRELEERLEKKLPTSQPAGDDVPDARRDRECRASSLGAKRDYAFARAHFELGESVGFMDFETATKLSGAAFRGFKKRPREWNCVGSVSCSMCIPEACYIESRHFARRRQAMFGTATTQI